MKNKNTTSSEPKSNRGIIETETKLIPLTHIYMTVHLPGVVHELQLKMAGLNLFYGPEHPLLVKR